MLPGRSLDIISSSTQAISEHNPNNTHAAFQASSETMLEQYIKTTLTQHANHIANTARQHPTSPTQHLDHTRTSTRTATRQRPGNVKAEPSITLTITQQNQAILSISLQFPGQYRDSTADSTEPVRTQHPDTIKVTPRCQLCSTPHSMKTAPQPPESN